MCIRDRPYTGCNPRGLMIARGKDLSKKLLTYHRIPVPAFACLLYTSDAADERSSVDLGGRRILKKKNTHIIRHMR